MIEKPIPEKTGKEKPSVSSLKNVFKTLIWPRRHLITFGLILIAITRSISMALPYSFKILVDDVIDAGTVSLALLLTAVGIAIAVQSVASFLLTKLLGVEAHQLIAKLRTELQQHIMRLPIHYFDHTKTGVMNSRIMADVEGVRNLVGTGFVQIIGGVLQTVFGLGILLSINVYLTVISLIPLICFGMIAMKGFAYIRPIFRERNRIRGEVSGRLNESLSGIRVIKGFNAESREENVFEDGSFRIFENVRKSMIANSIVNSSAVLLMGLASVIIMGFGGYMIREDVITLGDFVAFAGLLLVMVSPITQIANIGTQITDAFAGLDRMEEVFAIEKEEDDPNRTIELGKIRGEIQFENVWYAYEEENDVLRNINFTAREGTVTAFVGSSGSGKTTLANLVASFLKPRKGVVRVDGVDLSKVKLHTYRSQLGVVLQDDFLFAGSIRENILFSNPEATEEALLAAVHIAHVNEFTDRFEDGLETIIGERGVKLSGGQRQRVAIARALVADPRVLILDEATSNLDTESERMIQDSLQTLMKGRTTFVIAHRLSTIRKADQILVIENGKIVEQGKHDDLIAKEGRYHQLYTYQARI